MSWSYTTVGVVGSTPTVVGKSIVIGSDDGLLYVLDASNGRLEDNTSVGEARFTPGLGSNATFLGLWDSIVEKVPVSRAEEDSDQVPDFRQTTPFSRFICNIVEQTLLISGGIRSLFHFKAQVNSL